jgi:hypothetical protein
MRIPIRDGKSRIWDKHPDPQHWYQRRYFYVQGWCIYVKAYITMNVCVTGTVGTG